MCYRDATLMLRRESTRCAATPSPLPLALLGFVLAISGTYWDDAWHTDRGRDSFLIPPHISLYLGIALAGAALAWEAWSRVRSDGRSALRQPALALSCAGVVVTLAAGPIDNAWHLAFGRDAVLWSPPHMLGVAGSLALAVGLLMLFVDGGWPRMLQLTAAAAVLAVGLVPVLEYETDVPQFAVLWYLPVLAFGSAFALGLIKTMLNDAWAATAAAAAYAAVRLLISVVLTLAGLPAPVLPLVLLPALALDLTAQRTRSRALIAGVYAASVYLTYVPYLNWVKSDVFLDADDVLAGLPLAAALSYLGFLLADVPRRAATARATAGPAPAVASVIAVGLVLAGFLSSPQPTLAHDPGQGQQVAEVRLTTRSAEGSASLTVDAGGRTGCGELEPVALIARRAGETVRSRLDESGGCRFAGSVALDQRGRWFLYGVFTREGETLETWLPAHVGERETVSAVRALYRPPETSGGMLKAVSGILVYAGFAAVIVLIAVLLRRRRRTEPLPA